MSRAEHEGRAFCARIFEECQDKEDGDQHQNESAIERNLQRGDTAQQGGI